jgi:hypothetical protein
MAAAESPVVVCTYSSREHADEFVPALRTEGVTTVVVPSDRHAGEWGVVVATRDAVRAHKLVEDLLALD